MNSVQPIREIEVVTRLMKLAQTTKDELGRSAILNFTFHPNSIGAYGIEESQWQTALVLTDSKMADYGQTIEEAANRLLDRLRYPEKYTDDD